LSIENSPDAVAFWAFALTLVGVGAWIAISFIFVIL
jgi:hypothetical protein